MVGKLEIFSGNSLHTNTMALVWLTACSPRSHALKKCRFLKSETTYLGFQIIARFSHISHFVISISTLNHQSPSTKGIKGYTWDDECEEQFKAILSNYRTKLENANQATKFNSNPNELVTEIKTSILEASKECNLKKKKQKKNKKINPWFDKECLDLKKTLTDTGKKLRCDNGNVELKWLVQNEKEIEKNGVTKEKAS